MGISDRGTKAKSITSCDNAFVTNIVLARDPGASNASAAAHRTPPGCSALRESEASAANVFCAKAKRQQQSAQSERKSTTRYDDGHKIADKAINIDGNRHMALDLKWYSIV
ncbi:hypothetical protein CWD94_21435 [Lysinibacillus xylanilyticus]|uniref:Uncharacterized protein n=1 Tax=Lysinibacillus xylanilyticus TaxID=582475 RepID=A0A2M9Q0N2_9BACI|nr:hypothetical protein CWD94_21435 [Lysinibacillus xylanilyticus]